MAVTKKCRHARREWDSCTCTWYWDHRENGQRVYTPLRARTRTEAENEAGQGDRDFAADAQAWLEANRPRWRQGTYDRYEDLVARLTGMFGDWQTGEITGEVLDQFSLDAAERMPGSAKQLHSVLLRVIRFCGLTVPHHTPPPRTRRKKRRPFTNDEIRLVIQSLPERTRPMGEFAALTGLRLGELLGLRTDDLDGDSILVRRQRRSDKGVWDPKTETSERRVMLGPHAREIVRRSPPGWVFPFANSTAARDLREAFVRAGLYTKGVGWHSLRHFNATLRERSGEGLRAAGASLGHSASSQTLSYGWGESSQEIASQLEDHFQE